MDTSCRLKLYMYLSSSMMNMSKLLVIMEKLIQLLSSFIKKSLSIKL